MARAPILPSLVEAAPPRQGFTKTKPPQHTLHLLERNFSSRLGAPVQAIALHSTESWNKRGWDDLHGVRSWFNNAVSEASSHIGVDAECHVERWVRDGNKAWTILQLNPVTLNIEFVGRAAQPTSDWDAPQIRAGARWAAYWCRKFDIPVRRGRVKNVNGFPVITRKGIILHSDLTAAGFGTHTDPGKNFPLKRFLARTDEYYRAGWPPDARGGHE